MSHKSCLQFFKAAFAATALSSIFALCAEAQYAVEVVSYDEGTTPAPLFNQEMSAIGSPERFTGEGTNFASAVTPFNSPFLTDEIVSVGEGGQLTLRLSNFVIPQSAGPEIGVFTNSAIFDMDFPNGLAGDPVVQFSVDQALVEVSMDGSSWVSLGDTTFDGITNGYNDLAQTQPSDFQQPFANPISDFAGLNYSDGSGNDILSVLNGSGGGTWLDISSTGLSQVGFVRFSVADDNDDMTGFNFELDAVSIASSAVGPVTPEPSAGFLLVMASLIVGCSIRRRR